jgi:nucleotidyltransferase/DNA polymerase involved in DNA repair
MACFEAKRRCPTGVLCPPHYDEYRRLSLAMFNLERLDTQPTLWGKMDAERWGALDEATTQLNEQLGKNVLMTGSQLALRKRDAAHITPKAKCPFTPQREMVMNLFGENLP